MHQNPHTIDIAGVTLSVEFLSTNHTNENTTPVGVLVNFMNTTLLVSVSKRDTTDQGVHVSGELSDQAANDLQDLLTAICTLSGVRVHCNILKRGEAPLTVPAVVGVSLALPALVQETSGSSPLLGAVVIAQDGGGDIAVNPSHTTNKNNEHAFSVLVVGTSEHYYAVIAETAEQAPLPAADLEAIITAGATFLEPITTWQTKTLQTAGYNTKHLNVHSSNTNETAFEHNIRTRTVAGDYRNLTLTTSFGVTPDQLTGVLQANANLVDKVPSNDMSAARETTAPTTPAQPVANNEADASAPKQTETQPAASKEFAVGDVRPVTIKKITNFGAFAHLDGTTEGLIHVSEMAPFRIKPSALVTPGEVVDAKIVKIVDGKIGLSLTAVDPEFASKRGVTGEVA